jgi:hypothetical protein
VDRAVIPLDRRRRQEVQVDLKLTESTVVVLQESVVHGSVAAKKKWWLSDGFDGFGRSV